MPLPWTNKNRVTRISQIVADLHSPKRGASLVVQTGFPTSLIDLFVKNKNHFKTPNSNKPLRREIHDPPSLLPSSHPPDSPSSSDCTADYADCRHDDVPSLTPALITGNLHGNDGVSQVGKSDDGSGSKTVLAGFLKMLVVVVLIASVEKLTVGITVSAFMLLFLEYVAKRVVLCSNANVEVIKDCVWFQKLPSRIKKDCEVPEQTTIVGDDDNIILSDLVVGAECNRTNSLSFDEIEVVQTSMCSEETSCVDPKLDCVNRDKKLGCSEFDMQKDSNSNSNSNSNEKDVVDSCKVSLRETKGSRSVKIKSKMKKLLPKKLKGSRKEGKERRDNKRETETSIEEKSESFEVEEEENSGSRSPPLLKVEYVTEKEVNLEVNFCQEFSVERVEEVIVNSEERKISRVGSSGCIILSVIALVGLVVGRFPALILIMTWCFLLKIVTKRGRSMSPLIISSVPNS